MCQAIPRRVLQLGEARVQVLFNGAPTWVAVHDGIQDLAVGEYVMVYAGQVLERLPTDEAEALLRFYDEFERMVQEAAG